jgi:hypothetical protein
MKPPIKFKTTTQFVLDDRANSSIKRTSQQKIVSSIIALVVWLGLSANGQAPPGALWYNGDMNGSPDGIGLWNQIAFGSSVGPVPSQIYDDFTVTSPFGWNVTDVFSDNIVDTWDASIVGAVWEIRQGLSAGNPGNLIASGFTLTPTVTGTGRSQESFGEFRVTVTGLNLFLSPGQYY